MRLRSTLLLASTLACTSAPPPLPPATPAAAAPAPAAGPLPLTEVTDRRPPAPFPATACEPHLQNVRQLTFGGENAEAYWSTSGRELSLQLRHGAMACDRIARLDAELGLPSLAPVSSGLGATTCSYFQKGDARLVYASTHLAGDACPPRPDMRQGYVWALYDSYDIFSASRDGTDLQRLTETPGYDAEATVCPRDGSLIFTSVRDGDLELYRMDADGKNVTRLTHTPGYDGGAFFNADCSRIVWRASRPKPGAELDEYRALLGRGLVRPSKLEIYVANADGSDPVQLTYLDAASFAPSFFPDGRRVIFSSNAGDPRGREFDLWTVNVDGTQLQRVSCAPGFDGFPVFSPDTPRLRIAFSSNRATAPGAHDTNVFLADWVERVEAAPTATSSAAERIRDDIAWLAHPAREGRGLSTPGLAAAGAYVEARFRALGLTPAGTSGFRQPFDVTTQLDVKPTTKLVLDGHDVAIAPLGFSTSGSVEAPLVLAGHGVVDGEIDEYRGLDVKGKIVVVRRFVPEGPHFEGTEAKRRLGDLRYKAWVARSHGARGVLVVDAPIQTSTASAVPEAKLPSTEPEGPADAGLLVAAVSRAGLESALSSLAAGRPVRAKLTVALAPRKTQAFNVVGRIAARKPIGPPIVVGAHYDHLGLGGRFSLAPDKVAPHGGADDNASGTAVLLELARMLIAERARLQRDVIVVAFSGEEAGVLGSSHFVRNPPKGLAPGKLLAMLNFDMVGRLRGNSLSVLGGASAAEWPELVGAACRNNRVECATSGDGYGPSDHTAFYAAGTPVLHFFTGAHGEYHKPSDTVELINAGGAARIAALTRDLTRTLSSRREPLSYRNLPAPAPKGDLRSFNASLGTIPNYVGAPGRRGMLLDGVRAGSAAERAGLRRGDLLIKLGTNEIGGVEDLMFVLNASKPGETVTAVFVREGETIRSEVTFQESRRR